MNKTGCLVDLIPYLFFLLQECFSVSFIFLDFVYLFLEKGREKERARSINVWLPLECLQLGTWPTTQACALTGN